VFHFLPLVWVESAGVVFVPASFCMHLKGSGLHVPGAKGFAQLAIIEKSSRTINNFCIRWAVMTFFVCPNRIYNSRFCPWYFLISFWSRAGSLWIYCPYALKAAHLNIIECHYLQLCDLRKWCRLKKSNFLLFALPPGNCYKNIGKCYSFLVRHI